MTRWNRWPNGLLVCGATSLVATGCLSDDPNMDGVVTMTEGTSDPTAGDTSNDPTAGPGPGDATAEDTVDPSDATVDDTAGDPTDPPQGTTIYDIQGCGSGSVAPGSLVTLENVVVVSPVQVTDGFVFVQEQDGGQNSAILVYLYADVVMGLPLAPGDVITLTGTYDEFFEESQITVATVDDIMVTGTAALPAPPDVESSEVVAGAEMAECWEGVPVCLHDVTATDSTNQFGDFHVDDNMAATNLFLFDTDDFLQVTPGAAFADLCGPIRYTFEEYKIAPRSADDYAVSLVACADAATPATIQDVQQGMFMEDELVLLEDVVVTTPWSFSMQQFFVQDPGGGPYSGIQVYVPMEGDYVPMPGDQITVCGSYTEYFDQSQIQISNAADLVAAGNGPVPAPEVLAADELAMDPPAEQWEGVLVRVDDVTVTAEANMFGEWQIEGVLLLDDFFFEMAAWPTPMVDDTFTSITGVLTFSFENYKLAPRTEADIAP